MNLFKKYLIIGGGVLLLAIGAFSGAKIYKKSKRGGDVIVIDEQDTRYISIEHNKPDGASPEDYKNNAIEALYIANGVTNSSKYYDTYYEGVALAKVVGINYKQETRVTKIINDGEAFLETYSLSSLVKVADQRYVTKDSYLQRKGKNVTNDGATFGNDIIAMSKSKYLELYGNLPFSMSQYVLNNLSIDCGNFVSSANGLFTFSYDFVPEIATIKYQRQVKTMSGASDYPVFSKAHFDITIDEDFYVKSISFSEIYDLPMMGGLKITATATETFNYSNSAKFVKERAEFEPFFNAATNDDATETKSGMTYLTEAFAPLMNGNEINVSGKILFDDKLYQLYASIDLANMDIILSLNEDIVIYFNDKETSIILGNDSIKVNTLELLGVLSKYANIDLDSLSLDSLLESELVASLMSNMKEDISSNYCNMSIPTSFGDIAINLDIDDSDNASLNKINANLKIDNEPINLEIKFDNNKHNFRKIPTDAFKITNLDNYVNSIISLINSKALEINAKVNLDINNKLLGIDCNGYLELDINDITNSIIEANINITYDNLTIPAIIKYIDNNIYLSLLDSADILLSSDQLIELVNNFVSLDLDVNNIEIMPLVKDLLNNLDVYKLINYIDGNSDTLSISLNLEDFGLFNNLNIGYSITNGLEVKIDDLASVSLNKTSKKIVNIDSNNPITYSNINDLIDLITRYIENPCFDVNIDFNYKDLAIYGNAYVDANNLCGMANINVNYKGLDLPININYVDKTLYVNYKDNINVCLENQEIANLVSYITDLFDIDVDNLVNLDLDNIDLTKLIDIYAIDDKIFADVDILQFSDVDLPINACICNDTIDVSIGNYGAISIIPSTNKTIDVPVSDYYLNYNEIISYIDMVNNYLDNPIFEANVGINLKVNEKDLAVNGNVYVDLENMNIDMFANVKYDSISGDIRISKFEDLYQIQIGSLLINLTNDEIVDLLNNINNRYDNIIPDDIISAINNLLVNGNYKIDIDSLLPTIADLIDKIKFDDKGISLEIDDSLLGTDMLNTINANIYKNNQNIVVTCDGIDVVVNQIEKYDFFAIPGKALDYNSIDNLLDKVDSIIDYIDNKTFDLTVSGNVYNYQTNTTTYKIDGSLYIKLNDGNGLSLDSIEALNADLLLVTSSLQHKISLTIVDKVVYLSYSNYDVDDTKLSKCKGTTNAYISFEKLLAALNYANQMFIKNDLLNSLLASYGQKLTTSVLETAVNVSTTNIYINDIISDINISNTNFDLYVNHDILNNYNKGGIATVSITNTLVNDKVSLSSISIKDFYTDLDTKITLNASISNNEITITAPNTSNYINLNSIPDLLVTLNNTIELAKYDVSGTVTLSLGSWELKEIDLLLKVIVDNNHIKVYGKLEIPNVLIVTNGKTRTEIYFDNYESNNIYLKRSIYKTTDLLGLVYGNNIESSKISYMHQDANEFLNNFVDNLVYMFNFSDTISNLIKKDGSSSDTTMYYADLLNNYSYNNSKYSITVNGSSLTNGILKSLEANINTTNIDDENYLASIDASTSLLSIINAKVNASLNNFTNGFSYESFDSQMNSYVLDSFTN